MLQMENIKKSFRNVHILQGVQMVLNEPGIYLLYGGNGTGKSTLLKIAMGWLTADIGKIVFRNREITDQHVCIRADMGMSYMPQECGLLWDKTGVQNQTEARRYLKNHVRQEAAELYGELNIDHLMSRKINSLSRGELRKLEFAITFEHDAALYLLDEPLTGWDKKSRKRALSFLRNEAQRGKIILICDHEFVDITGICKGFIFLNEGLAIQKEKPSDFLKLL